VHDESAAAELLEGLLEGEHALVGVEVVDRLAPLRAEHSGGLVGARGRAGGDDEVVVVQLPAVGQVDLLAFGIDPIDLTHEQLDAVVDEGVPRATDVLALVDAERHEEVSRLVIVVVVLVDNDYPPILGRQPIAQLVGCHGAGGSPAEDHEGAHCGRSFSVSRDVLIHETIPLRVYSC